MREGLHQLGNEAVRRWRRAGRDPAAFTEIAVDALSNAMVDLVADVPTWAAALASVEGCPSKGATSCSASRRCASSPAPECWSRSTSGFSPRPRSTTTPSLGRSGSWQGRRGKRTIAPTPTLRRTPPSPSGRSFPPTAPQSRLAPFAPSSVPAVASPARHRPRIVSSTSADRWRQSASVPPATTLQAGCTATSHRNSASTPMRTSAPPATAWWRWRRWLPPCNSTTSSPLPAPLPATATIAPPSGVSGHCSGADQILFWPCSWLWSSQVARSSIT